MMTVADSSVETARLGNKAQMAVVATRYQLDLSIQISDRRIVSSDTAYDEGGKYVKFIRRHDDCYGLVVKQ